MQPCCLGSTSEVREAEQARSRPKDGGWRTICGLYLLAPTRRNTDLLLGVLDKAQDKYDPQSYALAFLSKHGSMKSEPTLIYETLHGSRAYGLARAGSDWDYKGIIVGPTAWYLGFQDSPEQLTLGPDHMRFEIRKFMRLAARSNPTLLEVLFTHPEDHQTMTAAGERLLAARESFLSKRVKDSFGGYALSQLKRIRTHRRWLLEPPKAAPTRAGFGLPERAVVPRDQMGAAEAMRQDGRIEDADLSPNFLDMLDRERRYKAAQKTWSQYQTWLKHRNPKRSALEAKFGYDTKHALHLVRLLRMGAEILETGTLTVRRTDRDELLAIRDGAWSYDELVEQAEQLSVRVEQAAAISTLPEDPDEAALSSLCVEIVEEVLR